MGRGERLLEQVYPAEPRLLRRACGGLALHGLDALYYDRMRSKDRASYIDLYLVPTTNNVVGVACYAPLGRPDGVTLEKCAQIAATLQLTSSHPFRLGARPAYKALLERAGIVTRAQLKSARRYAIVGNCAIAAVLTPPDVGSMLLLAVPLILLYELSLVGIWFTERRRARNKAVELG